MKNNILNTYVKTLDALTERFISKANPTVKELEKTKNIIRALADYTFALVGEEEAYDEIYTLAIDRLEEIDNHVEGE